MRSAWILLTLVILVSGCTEVGNIFGSDVVNIQRNIVSEGTKDVVIIKNSHTIPNPPVLPDQDVLLSLVLENRDDRKTARNVVVDLYNAPTFKNRQAALCNSAGKPCQPDKCSHTANDVSASGSASVSAGSLLPHIVVPGDVLWNIVKRKYNIPSSQVTAIGNKVNEVVDFNANHPLQPSGFKARIQLDTKRINAEGGVESGSDGIRGDELRIGDRIFFPDSEQTAQGATTAQAVGCTLLPGEQKQVKFEIKSPLESEIAGISTTINLEHLVNYDFTGDLAYTIPVVNLDEVLQRQQADEKISLNIQESHSSGPVFVGIELQGAQYMLASQDAVFVFKIQNKGSGSLKNSRIAGSSGSLDTEGFYIRFPEEFEIIEKPQVFACSDNLCYNNNAIDIFKDESRTSLQFRVKLNDNARNEFASNVIPFRSYSIFALANYKYELRNAVSITVNPFQNVG